MKQAECDDLIQKEKVKKKEAVKMSDWDSGSISTSMQRLGTVRDPASRESRTTAMTEFMNFIRSYREDGVFVYRCVSRDFVANSLPRSLPLTQ